MTSTNWDGCFNCLRADGSRIAGVSCEACTGDGLRAEIIDRHAVTDIPNPTTEAAPPTLHRDGVHDDTAAFTAMLAGQPVRTPDGTILVAPYTAPQPDALDARTVEACAKVCDQFHTEQMGSNNHGAYLARWIRQLVTAPQHKDAAGVDADAIDRGARALIDISPTIHGYHETHLEVMRPKVRAVLAAVGIAPAAQGDAVPVVLWCDPDELADTNCRMVNAYKARSEEAFEVPLYATPRPASDDARPAFWFAKTSTDDLYGCDHTTRDAAIREALERLTGEDNEIHVALARHADPLPNEDEDAGNLDHLYNETLTIAEARRQIGDDARDAGRLGFTRGVAWAVAALLLGHGDDNMAEFLIGEYGLTVEKMTAASVDEADFEPVRELIARQAAKGAE